jgi:hypothetical protein
VKSLKVGTAEILLASTIPTDAVRKKLFDTLEDRKRYAEGPAALEAAGMAGAVVSEPGFLVVLKCLPRKDAEPQRTQPTRTSRYGPKTPDAGGRSRNGQTSDQKPEHPEQLWMAASESLMRAMCGRMAAAARKGKGGKEIDPETRPVEIPSTANVVAEYDFDWPTSLANKAGLSGVSLDAMKIHYLRLEVETTPTKILGYLKRKMVRPVEHPVEHGYWMETFRNLPNSDRKQSIDVVVTRQEDMVSRENASRTMSSGQATGGGAGPMGGPPMGMASGAGGAGPGPGMMGPGAGAMPGGGGPRPGMAGPGGGAMPGGPSGGRSSPGGAAGASGAQAASHDRAERERSGKLVVEILSVEVKSPAPIAERPKADDI